MSAANSNPVAESRPLNLRLLDINDIANAARDIADALDMATMAINDTRQRNAMATLCDVLVRRMDELTTAIEEVREAV
jgi:hypothetical protein